MAVVSTDASEQQGPGFDPSSFAVEFVRSPCAWGGFQKQAQASLSNKICDFIGICLIK